MAAPSLLIDLRVAQSNRERGVPRYIQSLTLALAREFPGLDIACLIDPERDPPLMLDELAQRCRMVEGTAAISANRVTHFLQGGLFHNLPTIPELFPVELRRHQPKLGGLVYDLIPWIFPEAYLSRPALSRPYLRALSALPRIDRLFVISNSVRHDVVAIANAERDRVVTIYGGLETTRWPTVGDDGATAPPPDASVGTRSASEPTVIWNGVGERIEVRPPFWLYVGGDDYRKNLLRLVEAFALLKLAGPLQARLVIACQFLPERRAGLLAQVEALGLQPGVDVIVTGYVSDETLGILLANCMATIFPSLYEGLGLPVLESYMFAKPALASDTSSFVEIVPERCRFDPYSAASIADAVQRFQDDPTVAQESLAFAPKAIAMCQWPSAARKVGEWLYPPAEGTQAQVDREMWVVTSLPPERTGVGSYTQQSLGSPTKSVVFFTAAREAVGIEAARDALASQRHRQAGEAAQAHILPLSGLDAARRSWPSQPVLFVLGNSEHHLATLAHLLERGLGAHDVVHLHDVYLGSLLRWHFRTDERLRAGLSGVYPKAVIEEWLGQGSAPASPRALLGARWLVARAKVRHIVVNSDAAAEILRRDLGDLADGVRIEVLFLPIVPPVVPRAVTGPVTAERLRIGHFGILGAPKLPDLVVAACDVLAATRPIELVIAGFGVESYVTRYGLLREYLTLLESPTDDELQRAMAGVDCGVQLRFPESGESSGVVNQLLALHKQVVCTRTGSFVQLEGVVHLVPPDVGPADLAAVIERAAISDWPIAGDALVAARSPAVLEARLRELLELDIQSVPSGAL
ncbi:MAG TPA: glycosyltransferase [Candidatus Dormibacteraeota bacterium]|nr:glycosyltransferase [Candidatus Dormibacteraeota bacterium]